ncbi:Uu.00g053990.m01.CDS01 [Anthostomella pinea]|uniref:Uu.00g053990.m01.CDS01 n=1 Tax=Anthostomella pinea TaxID=933095 RepID=A0AAI8VWI8_9PEZI|nr:Uu.00g053990.m01.CDS01 [Anthostomella pinea]
MTEHAPTPVPPPPNTIISVASAKMGILDLPGEVLTEICSHCSQGELICLSLVSSRFRELAAAQLYRNFHIVFPDEDDPCFDSPIDGLAGGLDTFATSDYNYAQHLRDLSLDTLSAGDGAEAAYKPYLASVSCGKFMNTLLLLTLRRATALDSFRWNIRVELSKPVYKVLHSLKSLKHVHIRLQAGPSLYGLPPPLASFPANSSLATPQTGGSTHSTLFGGGSYGALAPPPVHKPSWKPRVSKHTSSKAPPTIAGFKNLESLSVLDMDNLDIITEIKTCVRDSSSTLRKLSLSFSDALAKQARKPCLDPIEPDESDEDEFQVVPLPTTVNYDSSGPAKVFRAQEERKVQESVLGRIFEFEPFTVKRFHVATDGDNEGSQSKPKNQPTDNRHTFVQSVEKISLHLINRVHGTKDLNTLEQQDMLRTILVAANKYVDSENQKTDARAASSSKEVVPSSTSGDSVDDGVATPATEEAQSSETTTSHQGSKAKTDDEVTSPEYIDITAPEQEQLVLEMQEDANDEEITVEASSSKTPASSAQVSKSPFGAGLQCAGAANRAAQRENLRVLEKTLQLFKKEADRISKVSRETDLSDEDAEPRIREAQLRLEAINQDVADIQHDMNVIEAEMDDADVQSAHLAPRADAKDELRRRMNEYARRTRGIGLHALSLHLIPIKASVLGRAIDLHMLKRITLLNVGPQAPFWVLMNKENQLQRLQLRKIFTDNVSLQFLQFVSELESLHELFILERTAKYKPESFAPQSKTTIEQIRRLVLRKHMDSIKRLMIKNEANTAWDIDEKTMKLMCRRGLVLQELAVIMSMRTLHTFIQHIAGLGQLRALQLISFRNDDTCLSVMRETRRFIVDALSHHPELKLEWLAMGDEDRAIRIVRKPNVPKKSKKSKGKGKEREVSGLGLNPVASSSTFPILPAGGWDISSDSDDDGDVPSLPRVKLELMEGVAFYDVWGVRIFKKEVMAGRL